MEIPTAMGAHTARAMGPHMVWAMGAHTARAMGPHTVRAMGAHMGMEAHTCMEVVSHTGTTTMDMVAQTMVTLPAA